MPLFQDFAAYEHRLESAVVSAPPVTVRNAAIKYLETVEAGTVAHNCDPWIAVKADKS